MAATLVATATKSNGSIEPAVEYEPFDEDLHRQLLDIQAETDRAQVKLAQYRRELPAQIAKRFAEASFQSKLTSLPTFSPTFEISSLSDWSSFSDLKEATRAFDESLSTLNELKKTLPALADKMGRLNTVLEDLPRLQQQEANRRAMLDASS